MSDPPAAYAWTPAGPLPSRTTFYWKIVGATSYGDVPVPGDYDGDGRTDPAVWRPSSAMWYALLSGNGYSYTAYLAKSWGAAAYGDTPVLR